MKYREYIHGICDSTDMDDKEDVTNLIKFLLEELMTFHSISMISEDKLKELMSAKDYEKWSEDMAKKIFREKVDRMEDGDFKQFCIEHFEEVTELR